MKFKTYEALTVLINISLNTKDYETFRELMSACQSEATEALQQISDTESETALDAAHFALYMNSDDEDIDDHISNCLQTYLTIIEVASEQHEADLSKAVSELLGQKSDEDQCDDILHLEKCLTIQSEETIK